MAAVTMILFATVVDAVVSAEDVGMVERLVDLASPANSGDCIHLVNVAAVTSSSNPVLVSSSSGIIHKSCSSVLARFSTAASAAAFAATAPLADAIFDPRTRAAIVVDEDMGEEDAAQIMVTGAFARALNLVVISKAKSTTA